MRRIHAFDGLRGLGAISIVLYHQFPATPFFWFWSSLDMFLVLSGYLISRIVLDAHRKGTWSLRNFLMRRVLRIWPVYFLTLLSVLAGLWVWDTIEPGRWAQTEGIAQSFFFIQFVDQYFAMDPARIDAYIPWFSHSWTVASEEQFYILWPMLMLALLKYPRWLLAIGLALLVFAFWSRTTGLPNSLLLTRIDGLVVGAVLGLAFAPPRPGDVSMTPEQFATQRRRIARICIITALAGTPVVAVYLARYHLLLITGELFPIPWAWFWPALITSWALLYGALALALLHNLIPRVSAVLGWAPLVYFGSISYAMYLFHIPLKHLVDNAILPDGNGIWLNQLVYWAALLACAQASRVLIEDRCEALKKKFPL